MNINKESQHQAFDKSKIAEISVSSHKYSILKTTDPCLATQEHFEQLCAFLQCRVFRNESLNHLILLG